MKIKNYTLLFLLALITSCSDSFRESDGWHISLKNEFINVSGDSFSFSSSGNSSQEFNIRSTGLNWKVNKGNNSWIDASPASGTGDALVTLSASANTSADTIRTAILYVEASSVNYKKAIAVSQAAAIPSLSVEDKYITIKGGSVHEEIPVNANCRWSAKCESEWLAVKANTKDGILELDATANTGTSSRTAYITISWDNKTTTISVTQLASVIESSETELNIGNVASSVTLSINAETNWTAKCSDSWIELSDSIGTAGEMEITITIAPNESVNDRDGVICFAYDGINKLVLTISQKGYYISATKELEMSSGKNTKELAIESNGEWSVVSSPEWVSLSKQSGNGSDTIYVTAEDNASINARSADIKVKLVNYESESIVNIEQSGKTLSLSSTYMHFGADSDTKSLFVTADGLWKTSSEYDWLSSTPTEKNESDSLYVSVQENLAYEDRNGLISVGFYEKHDTVYVDQDGKFFKVATEVFGIDAGGGVAAITINTNDGWTAAFKEDISWATLSEVSGRGGTTLYVTVDDNNSINSRIAELLITPDNAKEQGVWIQITQKPHYLYVDTEAINFFFKGGTSGVVNISSDTDFTITSSADWITVDTISTYSFVVKVAETTERRDGFVYVSMANLSASESYKLEIPVTQRPSIEIAVKDYGKDQDWNLYSGTKLSVTLSTYGADKDWNLWNKSKFKVNVTGYKGDSDWNPQKGTSGKVDVSGYPATDTDWNQ